MNNNYIVVIFKLLPLTILFMAGDALADTLSRESVGSALARAEHLRSCFSIRMDRQYLYEMNGNKAGETHDSVVHLNSSDGRFRITKSSSIKDSQNEMIITWNNQTWRGLQHTTDPASIILPSLAISDDFQSNHLVTEDLLPLLGLMVSMPVTERTPFLRISDAVMDLDQPASIREVIRDDRKLVEIILQDPFHCGKDCSEFIYLFDPAKDWLLVDSVREIPSQYSPNFDTAHRKEIKMIKVKKVDGVWMPILLKNIQTNRNNSPQDDDVYEWIIRLSNITMNPEINDDDFTIHVTDLPAGSAIVDNRLAISYKTGRNLIYMNGHLNEVKQPIDHEIKPGELKNLMKDAIPYIDPVATANESKLKTVTPTGRYAGLTRWGFILIGLGFASMGIILWRRNHA